MITPLSFLLFTEAPILRLHNESGSWEWDLEAPEPFKGSDTLTRNYELFLTTQLYAVNGQIAALRKAVN